MGASWSGASVGTKKSMAMLLLPVIPGLRPWLGTFPQLSSSHRPPPPPLAPIPSHIQGCFWRHPWETGWAYSIPEFQSRRDLLKTEQVEKSMDFYTHIPSNPRETVGQ